MTTLRELPDHLRRAVERETPAEAIRWLARPRPRSVLLRAAPAWIMGVPWAAITFPMFGGLVAVLLFSAPPPRVVPAWEYVLFCAMTVFAGAFALIGLGMLLAPFAAWRRARRTVHVITDRRLLTLTAGRTVDVKSIEPAELVSFERRERRNGRGTLCVVVGWERCSDGDRLKQVEELIDVANVAAAERLLLELRQRARPPAT